MGKKRLGIVIIGLGGAVGTTMVAGIELLKKGLIGVEGLPLADVDGLVRYSDIGFEGWDVNGDDLATAAGNHEVLDYKQYLEVSDVLSDFVPRPAIVDEKFLSNIKGENVMARFRGTETLLGQFRMIWRDSEKSLSLSW